MQAQCCQSNQPWNTLVSLQPAVPRCNHNRREDSPLFTAGCEFAPHNLGKYCMPQLRVPCGVSSTYPFPPLYRPLHFQGLSLHILLQLESESEVAQSCPTLCNTDCICSPPGSSVHGILQAGILEWGCHVLLQGIFLTQGSNPGLPHCGQMVYPLSHTNEAEHKDLATSLKDKLKAPRNWSSSSSVSRSVVSDSLPTHGL